MAINSLDRFFFFFSFHPLKIHEHIGWWLHLVRPLRSRVKEPDLHPDSIRGSRCKHKHSDKCSNRFFLHLSVFFSFYDFFLSLLFPHFLTSSPSLVVVVRRRHVDTRGKQALSHALEIPRRADYACNAPYSSGTCTACRLHQTPLIKRRQKHEHLFFRIDRSFDRAWVEQDVVFPIISKKNSWNSWLKIISFKLKNGSLEKFSSSQIYFYNLKLSKLEWRRIYENVATIFVYLCLMITIMQLRLYSEFRLVLIGREVEVKILILD